MKNIIIPALTVILMTGAVAAQQTQAPVPDSAPTQTAPAATTKDQQKQLKREEDSNRQQAKSDKAQRKALKEQDKAKEKAAKANHGTDQTAQ
jgi:hypothetical protein